MDTKLMSCVSKFGITEVNRFAVTTVSFINDTVLIFSSYSIFRFPKEFTQSIFIIESGSYFVTFEYTPSFSLVPTTYGKFILILVFCSLISVACVSCCDWDKVLLLVILLKILLIIISWYWFSCNTCFILAFYLANSPLFVIME